MVSSSDLKQLVEQSKQLSSHLAQSDLPHLERSLAQIEAQTRKLVEKTSAVDKSIDTRTAYLLANKGYNAEKVHDTLNSINVLNTFEVLEPVQYTDISSYLRHQREILMLTAVEQSKKATSAALEKKFRDHMAEKWKSIQKQVFEEYGDHKIGKVHAENDIFSSVSNQFGAIKKQPSTASITSTPKLASYSACVSVLNQARLKRDSFAVISEMRNIFGNSQENISQPIVECWELLACLLNEWSLSGNVFTKSSSRPLPLQYKDSYREKDDESNPNGYLFNRMIISGGAEYLENQFWRYIENHVRQNRAVVGGIPSIDSTIRAFIALKFKRYGQWNVDYMEIVDDQAIWAHLFYLVRSGFKKEALNFANEQDRLFSRSDPKFLSYLTSWLNSPNGRLPKNLRESLLLHWNSVIKPLNSADQSGKWTGGDPFKVALYKIIGKCEMNKKKIAGNDITPSLEDYIWFQMMLVSDGPQNEPSFEKYTLKDMSATMQKFGAAYFSQNGKNPTMWFKVLLLCAEFEKAVDYLLSTESFNSDAVHFAICMAYYGVLQVPSDILSTDASMSLLATYKVAGLKGQIERNQLNFARVIQIFIRPFAKSSPLESLQYVYLLGLFESLAYQKFALEFITDIILENSAILGTLIGQMAKDGSKVPGKIQGYIPLIGLNTEDYQEKIIKLAAEKCYNQSRFQDAVKLYDIAGNFDKVLDLINQVLCDSLTDERYPILAQVSLFKSPEEDPVLVAEEIIAHYLETPSIASKISMEKRHTCGVLISMHKFMKFVVGSDFKNAIATLDSIELIPSVYDVSLIQRKALELDSFNENIIKTVPLVLLAAMSCLSKLWSQTMDRSKVTQSEIRQERLMEIKNRSKAVVLFAASTKYRIPSDIYATLNKLEVEMK